MKRYIRSAISLDDEAKINSDLWAVLEKFMTGPKGPFKNDPYWEDYFVVEIAPLKENPDTKVIEVRGEMDYYQMEELSRKFNRVLSKYDKGVYFEPEDAGILVAYLRQ